MERRALKSIVSTGSAMNIELGFVPNCVHLLNQTPWRALTVDRVIESRWDSRLADAAWYGYSTQNPVTNGMEPVQGSTNGFTPYDTYTFASRDQLPTGISKATRGIVTVSGGHGFTAAANDGDTISFNLLPSDSMYELNGQRTSMTYINSTTFYIEIDTTGYTTFDASTTRAGIFQNLTADDYANTGFKGITIGTDLIGSGSDVLLLDASWYDSFDQVTS